MKLEHFGNMNQQEINELKGNLVGVAADWAKRFGCSGLSEFGNFDVYKAIQEAVQDEYSKARTGS